ncbi:hypothetical protein C8J57DRAFT_1241203 [Mycena rebaudengoi]|nr:hypothetical protein C8J57DRAFT_1241203 [Mycena rebaudengoi]
MATLGSVLEPHTGAGASHASQSMAPAGGGPEQTPELAAANVEPEFVDVLTATVLAPLKPADIGIVHILCSTPDISSFVRLFTHLTNKQLKLLASAHGLHTTGSMRKDNLQFGLLTHQCSNTWLGMLPLLFQPVRRRASNQVQSLDLQKVTSSVLAARSSDVARRAQARASSSVADVNVRRQRDALQHSIARSADPTQRQNNVVHQAQCRSALSEDVRAAQRQSNTAARASSRAALTFPVREAVRELDTSRPQSKRHLSAEEKWVKLQQFVTDPVRSFPHIPTARIFCKRID